jgi:hypothetical protein
VSPPVAADTRVIELLEGENEFLRSQIAVKDEQIKDLAEHVRSANGVITGLSRRLPLLSSREEAHAYSVDHGDDPPTE